MRLLSRYCSFGSEWSPAEVYAVPTATQRRPHCGVAPLLDIRFAMHAVSISSYTGYVGYRPFQFPAC